MVKELPLTIKEKVMSTYDLLIQKGCRQGIEQGAVRKSYEVVSNLLATGTFSIAELANFATVTEDVVKQVRADRNRKKK